jgi:hypothetical protein
MPSKKSDKSPVILRYVEESAGEKQFSVLREKHSGVEYARACPPFWILKLFVSGKGVLNVWQTLGVSYSGSSADYLELRVKGAWVQVLTENDPVAYLRIAGQNSTLTLISNSIWGTKKWAIKAPDGKHCGVLTKSSLTGSITIVDENAELALEATGDVKIYPPHAGSGRERLYLVVAIAARFFLA